MLRLKRVLADLYTRLLSRPWLQPLHEAVLKFTLYAMNIGYSEQGERNGERRWLLRMRRLLERTEPQGTYTLFDVGANVGRYSRELYEAFGTSASIHAFEPSAAAFRRLEQNTAAIPGIVRIPAGAGERTETAVLYTDAAGSSLASLYPRESERLRGVMEHTEPIELLALDDYCAARGIERIHLLKLDIEGNEYRALLGARRLLESGAVACIQFEFGAPTLSARVSFHDLYALLRPRYRIFRILRTGLREIDAYRESSEIFLYQNLVALSPELAERL